MGARHAPRRFWPAACLAVALLPGAGPARAESRRPGESPAAGAALQPAVAKLLQQRPEAARMQVGLLACDLRTGAPLAAVNAEELFIPASNQKLLTAAVALGRLGADFEFVTAACLVGRDLWVLGAGDPSFGDPVLARRAKESIYREMDRWAATLRKALPEGIPGDLIVCGAFGANQKTPQESFRHPDWPASQYHLWYTAPAAAINFHNNCLDVSFRRSGAQITPTVAPASRLVHVVSQIRPASRHLWSVRLSQEDSLVTLTGTASASSGEPVSVPVNDPLLLFGRVLADRLARAEVKLAGRVRTAAAPPPHVESLQPICHAATALSEVLGHANKRSLNMAAECLFLRSGDGTWAGSATLASRTLSRQFGLDANHLAICDGSGLSRRNRVSPSAMVKLLAGLAARPDGAVVIGSLPVAGTDGTMRSRLGAAPYRGRVLAKTGYLHGVSCLSGYVLDRHHRPAVAFSILVNGVPAGQPAPARRLEDDLAALLVDHVDQPG